ncbi:MAG: hypothetical protein MJZ72_10125 [Bacteroidales bacterium]|nr:hypothetical protein [Bacteroidales bacterium]
MSKPDKASPYYRKTLKECTEKYWRVSNDKAYKATHVLGCDNGIVKCVIEIKQVKIATQPEHKGRKIFEGIEIQQSDYIGLNIREIFNTLANFNTKYYNL